MSEQDEALAIEVRAEAEGVVTIVLQGDLDPHTAPRLDASIATVLADGPRRLVLDLAGLQFIDSSGLRVLIGAFKGVERNGGRLTLRDPSPTALRLLEITDLVEQFEIEGTPA